MGGETGLAPAPAKRWFLIETQHSEGQNRRCGKSERIIQCKPECPIPGSPLRFSCRRSERPLVVPFQISLPHCSHLRISATRSIAELPDVRNNIHNIGGK